MIWFIFGILIGAGIVTGVSLYFYAGKDGTLFIDETDPTDVRMKLEFDIPMERIIKKHKLKIKIEKKQ